MRESWTDERLDDFRDDVNRRFDRVDREIRDLRTDTKAGFDDMHRLIITVGGGLIGTVIVAFAGLIATQL
jgi:hypothetical protein